MKNITLDDCVMNAPAREEYAEALNTLENLFGNSPHNIVAIDGKPDVGKTKLGRFLAWRLNITFIETDLFLIRKQGKYVYKKEHLRPIIESLIEDKKHVIIEGIVALRLIANLGFDVDYHIHVICEQSTATTLPDYADYIEQYKPKQKANLILDIPAIED